MMNAVEVENLTVHYDKNPVIWDISFSLPQGALCGIAGPNGAGKSTLLKAMMGLVQPLSGRVRFFQHSFKKMRKQIAYVPQRESIDWDFPIVASDVVLMGRTNRFGWLGRPRAADREAAAQALRQLGMEEFAHRQIGQLSGGQQQRLFLARALVQEPDILILDEPFRGVDLLTEELIIDLLRGFAARRKTILMVFHDLTNAKRIFDWLILVNRRLIAAGPLTETLTQENLAKTFGKGHALFEEATLLSAKTLSGLE
jgi:manganese/zinc/iron transport system ATP- binding protein